MISSISSARSSDPAMAASSSFSSAAMALTGPAPSITSATALRPDISPTSWLKYPMVTSAIDGHLALVGLLLPDDHPEQRRLAGTIGTDKPHLLTPVEGGGSLDEDDLVAVLLADIVEANHARPRSLR